MNTCRWATTVATLGLLAGLTGCASDDSPAPEDQTASSPTGQAAPSSPPAESAESAPEEPEAAEPVAIAIEDFAYTDPGPVAPGTEIEVTNNDDVVHTVTAEEAGDFDVSVDPGATVTFTAPSEPGDYPYFCTLHPSMTSSLVVE